MSRIKQKAIKNIKIRQTDFIASKISYWLVYRIKFKPPEIQHCENYIIVVKHIRYNFNIVLEAHELCYSGTKNFIIIGGSIKIKLNADFT